MVVGAEPTETGSQPPRHRGAAARAAYIYLCCLCVSSTTREKGLRCCDDAAPRVLSQKVAFTGGVATFNLCNVVLEHRLLPYSYTSYAPPEPTAGYNTVHVFSPCSSPNLLPGFPVPDFSAVLMPSDRTAPADASWYNRLPGLSLSLSLSPSLYLSWSSSMSRLSARASSSALTSPMKADILD